MGVLRSESSKEPRNARLHVAPAESISRSSIFTAASLLDPIYLSSLARSSLFSLHRFLRNFLQVSSLAISRNLFACFL